MKQPLTLTAEEFVAVAEGLGIASKALQAEANRSPSIQRDVDLRMKSADLNALSDTLISRWNNDPAGEGIAAAQADAKRDRETQSLIDELENMRKSFIALERFHAAEMLEKTIERMKDFL